MNAATTPSSARLRTVQVELSEHAIDFLLARKYELELSEHAIDFLLARKYELERTDNASIGQAVSAFVSDAALEWA